MRGKVIYRIACGTCSVCITYGLVMQALQGKDSSPVLSADTTLFSAVAVTEILPEEATIPAAEPTIVPYIGDGTESDRGSGRGRSRKNRGKRDDNSGSFREQKQDPETASAEEPQDTGSTVQESPAGDSPPSLNEYLSTFRCGGCRHNCSLLNPRCMKGRTKKQNAVVQYQETYGG